MRVLVVALITLCVTASAADAQPFANAKSSLADYTVAQSTPQKACESLATFKGEGIDTIQAQVVPASADAPQHCRVSGVIAPEIAFEVNLPDHWNQRFYMIGNGGHAGEALDAAGRVSQRSEALANGFVMAQTNTGHDSRKEPGASFVMSNPQKAVDYAYRAVHLTADTAKRIATDYYAKPVSVSRTGTRARTADARVSSRHSAIPTISMGSWPTRHGSTRPGSRLARCGISAP